MSTMNHPMWFPFKTFPGSFHLFGQLLRMRKQAYISILSSIYFGGALFWGCFFWLVPKLGRSRLKPPSPGGLRVFALRSQVPLDFRGMTLAEELSARGGLKGFLPTDAAPRQAMRWMKQGSVPVKWLPICLRICLLCSLFGLKGTLALVDMFVFFSP